MAAPILTIADAAAANSFYDIPSAHHLSSGICTPLVYSLLQSGNSKEKNWLRLTCSLRSHITARGQVFMRPGLCYARRLSLKTCLAAMRPLRILSPTSFASFPLPLVYCIL